MCVQHIGYDAACHMAETHFALRRMIVLVFLYMTVYTVDAILT